MMLSVLYETYTFSLIFIEPRSLKQKSVDRQMPHELNTHYHDFEPTSNPRHSLYYYFHINESHTVTIGWCLKITAHYISNRIYNLLNSDLFFSFSFNKRTFLLRNPHRRWNGYTVHGDDKKARIYIHVYHVYKK
jgi:hypothetical protein